MFMQNMFNHVEFCNVIQGKTVNKQISIWQKCPIQGHHVIENVFFSDRIGGHLKLLEIL